MRWVWFVIVGLFIALGAAIAQQTMQSVSSVGKLGIGTTAPMYNADIRGTIGITGKATFKGTIVNNSSASSASGLGPCTSSNVTGVMCGLAQTFVPGTTGKVYLRFSNFYQLTVGTVATPTVSLRFGTGTPPTPGSALAGTVVSTWAPGAPGLNFINMDVFGVETSCAAGVTCWYDESLACSNNTNTCQLSQIQATAAEL